MLEKPIFIKVSESLQPYYEIPPPVGYTPKKNYPNCCKYHKHNVEIAQEWFNRFPDCCDYHRKMKKSTLFEIDRYTNAVEKIITQVAYTEHIINEKINAQDWYEDITDYLELNLRSFGQPSVGDHIYSHIIKHFVTSRDVIPTEKKEPLLQFLAPVVEDPKESKKPKEELPNPNIIFDIYQRWLKAFPFQIDFFKDFEKHFKDKWILTIGKPKVNRYSGIATSKLITEVQLIDFLDGLTKQLLSTVDTNQLYKEGKLSEYQKKHLEIGLEAHRVTQLSNLSSYYKKEKKYITTIKNWLNTEKAFFGLLKDIDTIKPPKPELTKAEKLQEHLNKYGFENLPKVERLNSNQRQSLINILAENKLPYQIAMLDFLGFIAYMRSNHTRTNEMLFKRLANILDRPQRSISGNYRVLSAKTDENTERYTAHTYKETVEKDYKTLK